MDNPLPISRRPTLWQRKSIPQLSLVLGADAIVVAGNGVPNELSTEITLALPSNVDSWTATLQPLADWLDANPPGDASIAVQLANRYARFALMPWSSEVQGAEEEQTLALACLETQYGDMSGWTVCLDPGTYGEARLICAIETSLLDALRETLEPRGIRCSVVQPYFVTCWNRWYKEISKAGPDLCFAVSEGDTAVMAIHQGGHWHSIRVVGYRDLDLVPTLAEREPLLQGLSEPLPVYLHSPGLDAARRQQWSERCHLLDTSSINATPALAMALVGVDR